MSVKSHSKSDYLCVASSALFFLVGLTGCYDDNNGSVAQSSSSASSAVVTNLHIVGQPSLTAQQGVAYDFKPTVSGDQGQVLAFSIVNKPAWATFNTSTGELSGVPDVSATYADVTITVTNGKSSAVLTKFAIDVVSVATSGAVVLSWVAPKVNADGTTLADVARYVIHYGTDASELDQSVIVSATGNLAYHFNDLRPGVTYYFAIATINSLNVESDYSDLVNVTA